MDPAALDLLAPMLVAIVLILTTGGVILLRPLSKRLGDLLEAMADERKNPVIGDDLSHIRAHLDTMSSRLALLEERQDFQEKLMSTPDPARLRPPTGTEGQGTSG